MQKCDWWLGLGSLGLVLCCGLGVRFESEVAALNQHETRQPQGLEPTWAESLRQDRVLHQEPESQLESVKKSDSVPENEEKQNEQDGKDETAETSPERDQSEGKPETEAERDERLARYLTGTRWTGRFTFTGQEEKVPTEEKYEIIEAKKAESGDGWNLVARIQYEGKDVTLPLPTLQIKWAGETPVITVDKMVIPGMGTFDARVLIRKGQYAGTWAHGQVGGHLFGRIEKIEK